jgi:RNA-directed DNA polymerase
MRNKRQKNQLELAFPTMVAGEVRRDGRGGTEFRATKPTTESPATMGVSMEDVLDRENLRKALRAVRRNKGAPGTDEMTVDELPVHLEEHWPAIRDQLLQGAYAPQPVRRVMIPKVSGGERPLGIPTVLDRLIQQAVLQALQPRWDPTFSEQSYGFRPGRSAHQAVARAQEYVAAGHAWVVDLDLAQFFDRVNHDRLMAQVAKRVDDKRLLKLIRGFLTAGAMEGGVASPTVQGTPQGGPLSPLLSNLVLDELDRELEKRCHHFVRYADDCNIYVCSERAGQRVMASVTQFVESKLKLKVNAAKSAVAQPWQRQFLGFSLTAGERPKRAIAPKARARFKQKVRELTGRTRGRNLKQMIEDLTPYLRGWRGYFGFCETPTVLARLDRWTRRRLRAVVWKQWRRGKTRYRNLRRRGVDHGLAARTAGSAHGPWRLSDSKALHVALPNAHFVSLGLPPLQVSYAA